MCARTSESVCVAVCVCADSLVPQLPDIWG